MKKRVALLGATGSIGKSALDVLRAGRNELEPVLFTAHTDIPGLLALSREFPGVPLALSGLCEGPPGIHYYGREGLLRSIEECGPDIALNGIAGAPGLEPSLAVLESGADLALANKETIVMASSLVVALAAKKGARILPVDSEHSAIFNLMEAHGREQVEGILLTASGGPFRKYSLRELAAVKAEDALVHPTWSMGSKITVDSASMANKGLEIIEAAGLFAVAPEDIQVVVHPQSIVHSMIWLRDGAVYGQLSRPDMRLPIQQALYYPEKRAFPFGRLSFDALTLEFEKPDGERFPMLPLAYEAARRGGYYPVAYNAANEEGVSAFLAGTIGFLDISRTVEYVLQRDWIPVELLSPEAILEADSKSRRIALQYIKDISEKNKCFS
ncbi:MAG: 1-deoxy-D-xylulose-5-phosphate reductoisomerase [Spirochaetaceae bacterium]|jgi:1-deoxy-D-xylulose-5-phosphate reductoisomerase|nr:1-deoxy-D-xylulose-5-phosphate reductoisomerase [Spirochaetaceae bacterium]